MDILIHINYSRLRSKKQLISESIVIYWIRKSYCLYEYPELPVEKGRKNHLYFYAFALYNRSKGAKSLPLFLVSRYCFGKAQFLAWVTGIIVSFTASAINTFRNKKQTIDGHEWPRCLLFLQKPQTGAPRCCRRPHPSSIQKVRCLWIICRNETSLLPLHNPLLRPSVRRLRYEARHGYSIVHALHVLSGRADPGTTEQQAAVWQSVKAFHTNRIVWKDDSGIHAWLQQASTVQNRRTVDVRAGVRMGCDPAIYVPALSRRSSALSYLDKHGKGLFPDNPDLWSFQGSFASIYTRISFGLPVQDHLSDWDKT